MTKDYFEPSRERRPRPFYNVLPLAEESLVMLFISIILLTHAYEHISIIRFVDCEKPLLMMIDDDFKLCKEQRERRHLQ